VKHEEDSKCSHDAGDDKVEVSLEEEAPQDFEFMGMHTSLPGDINDGSLFTPFQMMVSSQMQR
jgi:hypothetical protein